MLNFFHPKKNEEGRVVPEETWKETHTGLSLAIILYIGWKNLKTGRARSILTIGGVALGIGIITFLLCVGFGMQRMIVNEVTKNNPQDVIDINNGNLENFVSLNEETVNKIKNIEGVEKVEVQLNTGGKVIFGESQTDVVIFGVDKEFLDLSRIAYFAPSGEFSNSQNKVLVSSRLANLLGFENPNDAIGKQIIYDVAITKEVSSKISEEKVSEGNVTEIVGVVSEAEGNFIYVPMGVLRNDLGVDLAQTGKVLIGNMDQYYGIKQQLEQMGFLTESINDLIKDIDSFFNTIRAVLVVFGVIVMSISVMGMINTLSVSLLQRTKEIGILKALGTKRFDVFKMFVLEAIIISFVGGVLGFFGGFGLAILVNQLLIYMGKKSGVEISQFVYLPFYFIVTIGGFIVFLGFATGIMPAFRAAKIHALEALRYE